MTAHTETAYALVLVRPDGRQDFHLTGIRRRKKDLIRLATKTFYNGSYNWPYIKKIGWRIQKVKITAVRP